MIIVTCPTCEAVFSLASLPVSKVSHSPEYCPFCGVEMDYTKGPDDD